MDGAMQASDGRVTFRMLMEAWQDDFNAAREPLQLRYDNFTGFYQCIKVFKKGDGETAICCAHLHEDPRPGVEITEGDDVSFIPAEDPSLFPRLVAKIEQKYKDLVDDAWTPNICDDNSTGCD